tara:strand:+ start:13862 stop:14512 length:651 start_codon:yes stop_codon:yes gene_type:complete
MKKKLFVYLVTIFFLLFNTNHVFPEINNSVIISVGKYPITRLDLFKEIKLIAILSGGQITEQNKNQIKELAVQSLIKKAIKTSEIEKRKIERYNKKDLDQMILGTAKNLGLDKKGLKALLENNNLSYEKLVEKFTIDLKWNSMIFKIYKNKISLNTLEIENKLNLQLKNLDNKDKSEKKIEAIKESIVNQEKNKKLMMFSNSHYSSVERITQIKFL